ncbi:hypothetical protein LTR09_011903 [Extremus antarcticus]|uniref:Uncharacterized protein n=1 Tax=Extremus antarcticus TaxID=702011 RepID=A0AAJ0D5X4_9PEZI|nr:hypothetical protein LTR09_011903 [Extremus antarcticus]
MAMKRKRAAPQRSTGDNSQIERSSQDHFPVSLSVTKPHKKPGKLVGPAYFLEIPTEIRLEVYSIVLANVRPFSSYRHPGTRLNQHSSLRLRHVSRQIAEETIQFLFRVFDVGWLLNMDQPYRSCDLKTAIRGQ